MSNIFNADVQEYPDHIGVTNDDILKWAIEEGYEMIISNGILWKMSSGVRVRVED